jgi:hypothetical protein
MQFLVIPVSVLLILILIIMNNFSSESARAKASARDFFLHLGAIVGLYTVTVSFINLTFKVINKAFPEVAQNIYAWGAGSEISLPVATLIIFFPIFIALSYFVQKIYNQNPEKKELSIRKWLTYITLFVAGIALAGDLVTVLYKFLDGQDLTAAFLLKALVVLLSAGGIFGFYIQDIRNRISDKSRRIWAICIGVVFLISIIAGFSVLGSPKTQRLLRLDSQKISDLQNIQWEVINHWQVYGIVPESISDNFTDPQTKEMYQYKRTGPMTFEICAVFNLENEELNKGRTTLEVTYPAKGVVQNDNWNHSAGEQCFSRTIDPIAYPTQVRG